MAENPGRRPDDSENDIVAAAFASYRARASEELSGPPATTVFARAAAASRPRRRFATAAVGALACTALMAAGVAVAQNVAGGGGSDSDSGRELAEQDAETPPDSAVDVEPTKPDPETEQVESELRTLTVTLPEWPGELAADCPAGDFRFFSENSGVDEPPSGEPSQAESGEGSDPGEWRLLPSGTHVGRGDVGFGESDTLVTPVACGETPGVVALSHAGESFVSHGFVYAAAEPGAAVHVVSVENQVVALSFSQTQEQGETETTVAEVRHFAFDGEQFTEVDPDQDGSEDETDEPGDPSDPGGETSPSDDPSSDDPGTDDDGDDESPRQSNTIPEDAEG